MQPRKKRRLDPNTVVLLKRIFTGIVVMASTALVITAVWYGTRMQAFTIDTVSVEGGETIDRSAIEKLVQLSLDGSYIGLVPRRFTWLYPRSEILEALGTFERIHDISIRRISGTELLVTFKEYVPKALWCESIESDECFFLDSTGFAFGHAPKLSGGSLLRFVRLDQSAVLHESVVSEASFNKFFRLSELLSQQNWFISHIEIGQDDDAFLHIVGGGELRVITSQPVEETVENLFVILGSEEFKHISPGNFQYIDLRYGNKVFVNEELAAPQGEAASETASSTNETDHFE